MVINERTQELRAALDAFLAQGRAESSEHFERLFLDREEIESKIRDLRKTISILSADEDEKLISGLAAKIEELGLEVDILEEQLEALDALLLQELVALLQESLTTREFNILRRLLLEMVVGSEEDELPSKPIKPTKPLKDATPAPNRPETDTNDITEDSTIQWKMIRMIGFSLPAGRKIVRAIFDHSGITPNERATGWMLEALPLLASISFEDILKALEGENTNGNYQQRISRAVIIMAQVHDALQAGDSSSVFADNRAYDILLDIADEIANSSPQTYTNLGRHFVSTKAPLAGQVWEYISAKLKGEGEAPVETSRAYPSASELIQKGVKLPPEVIVYIQQNGLDFDKPKKHLSEPATRQIGAFINFLRNRDKFFPFTNELLTKNKGLPANADHHLAIVITGPTNHVILFEYSIADGVASISKGKVMTRNDISKALKNR